MANKRINPEILSVPVGGASNAPKALENTNHPYSQKEAFSSPNLMNFSASPNCAMMVKMIIMNGLESTNETVRITKSCLVLDDNLKTSVAL
jgi:hypothetical protein